ncbi:MAG: asparagine synthase (glutamine-hydrolyzing), partial [Bryobacteraceae bacterium]
MCGICGIIGPRTKEDAGRIVRRMNAAMHHRGPDEEGLLIAPPQAPHVSFGMRRLSIIDLPGGHQPVANETGDVAVVFNGEIYNFAELRADLASRGHRFSTRSDTEVIVHAYEQWGESCVSHLRGMFTFALLDSREGEGKHPKVFLARDRLGIKPLYYACVDGALVFASEVRAILASGTIPRRISREALDSYLLFGSVCEPMTLVEGVFSLPPGHLIALSAHSAPKEAQPRPYWTFADAAAKSQGNSRQDPDSAAPETRRLLERAVAEHLVADVPLGIFLSSGLDSTAIVALASHARAGLNTFTVVFTEEDFSEAKIARATAKRFGTHHEELLLHGGEMLDRVDEAVGALDQPTMDGINTFFVSWAAHRVGLKVALSGLGGDEVFGGYSTFATTPRISRLAAFSGKLPRSLRSATAAAVGRAAAGGHDAGRKLAALWRNGEALPHPYFFSRALYTPEQVATLRGGSPASGPG